MSTNGSSKGRFASVRSATVLDGGRVEIALCSLFMGVGAQQSNPEPTSKRRGHSINRRHVSTGGIPVTLNSLAVTKLVKCGRVGLQWRDIAGDPLRNRLRLIPETGTRFNVNRARHWVQTPHRQNF